MSFGISIGDIIALGKLATRIGQRFLNAPGQFRAISDESVAPSCQLAETYTRIVRVRCLSIVLQDVEIVLPERRLTSKQKSELDGIAQGCRNILDELEEILGRYQELDSSANYLGGMPRRVWKTLKWDLKEIDGIRGRISSNILLFNTFLTRIIG